MFNHMSTTNLLVKEHLFSKSSSDTVKLALYEELG